MLSYFILLQATPLSVLVVCIFQGIGLFHLTYQICGHRIVHNIPLLSSDVCEISSEDPSLVSDVGNLRRLFFFFSLVSLTRGLSVDLSIGSAFGFFDFSLFIFTDSCSAAAAAAAAKSLQSCLTLCDPIDGSPPGSAVPGILQARTLEWVAISFSSA